MVSLSWTFPKWRRIKVRGQKDWWEAEIYVTQFAQLPWHTYYETHSTVIPVFARHTQYDCIFSLGRINANLIHKFTYFTTQNSLDWTQQLKEKHFNNRFRLKLSRNCANFEYKTLSYPTAQFARVQNFENILCRVENSRIRKSPRPSLASCCQDLILNGWNCEKVGNN